MKIRTLLIASVVTFSILLLIISGLVIVTNQQIGKLVEQEATANTIALEVGELGYLSNDYILFREPQQADRWNTKYASISDDIASLSVDQPEQQAIVRNLEANLRNTRSVFDDIASNPAQPDRTADTGFVQLSWSRMAVQNQGMVFDTVRLANLLNEDAEELMRVRNLLIFALMGVFIAFLFTSYLIFYRRALTSITAITNGIKEIASGNLNYQLETGTDDEIGDIAQGLNRMTADLRLVTASKTDLEREVSERMRAEAQLVRNNEDLNALNEELTAAQEELHQNLDELSKREIELHSVALFPTENPSPTMRVNDQGNLLFANPASTHVLRCWKVTVGEKVPDHIIRSALDSLEHGIMQETEEICEPYTYLIQFTPISPQNYINLYFSDITRRKRAEDLLLRKNEDLNALNEELTAAQEELHQNVEELTHAERMLRESEEKYRIIFETANEGIWITDAERKTILINQRMADMLGYPVKEVLGRTPSEFLGTGQELVRQKTSDDLKKGESTHREFKFRRKDGSDLWVISSASPVFDDKGNYLRTVSLLTDITVRKMAEDALRESEERFRLALRNAPVSVAIQDKDLVFQWAFNQRTVRPEEVKGKKDTDIFTPEDAARLIELKRECLGTGREVRKKIWITMNGKQVFLDLYLEPLQDDNGQITGIGIATVDLTEQKLIEDALRYSEENLLQAQELLDAVTKGTDVIIAVQDKNFRYIFFNQPYKEEIKRLTGKDLTLGSSMIDVFAKIPEEQKMSLDEWSKVLDGENVNQTISFGGPGSHRRVYHVLHTPIRDAKGTIIAAGEVAFDITRQAEMEEALRETKEYLDNLITYANAPIIVWDPQFRITLFNHAFEHLTGRKAKEVIGKPLEILLPENYLASAMDLIRKTMEGERWESVEIPILHKKGGVRTVLWNSASIFGSDGKTIISTIAQGQDITDRKKIESEYRHRAAEYAKMNVALEEEVRQRKISDSTLKNTLSLLNASLESTADGILVVDQQGKITSFNKNFMNMWNIPQEVLESGYHQTVINHVLPQLKNPEGYLTSIRELENHQGRESFDMVEFNDGKIFERYSKPQKIGESVVGRVWSFRDITDRKHAEENLLASIHEKEVLLREIHHRVKNNLQLISGLLDMTRMRTVDESTNTILTDLMLKIQTMAQIHTRLYESKQFGKISLTGQIRDQVTALSNIYSHKGHEIICEMDAQEIFLPVDQAIPCALVVNEILSNAYKHAFKGRKRGTIEISAVQENGQIRITVRDDGIGIPDNFDISRTNSLGLKLIRTLVQAQLKGSLMFKSRNGTEVTMEFPVITGGT